VSTPGIVGSLDLVFDARVHHALSKNIHLSIL
jgi:hypothetical protein